MDGDSQRFAFSFDPASLAEETKQDIPRDEKPEASATPATRVSGS